MPTFQTIQDRVTRRVIDLPAAVTAEVADLVNMAMVTLQNQHRFKVMEAKTGQLTTVVTTRPLSSAVPSDFKALRGLPYLVRNDGTTRDLEVAADEAAALDAYSLNDPNDKGEPRLILDPEPDETGARTWQVFPFPDGNADWSGGEYRVVVPYWRFLTPLDGGTDENWFTSNADWWLTFQATAHGFFLDWDEERGAFWEGEASKRLLETVKRDKLERLGSVRSLAVHKDVWAPQLRR
jgi:hypothetical protein